MSHLGFNRFIYLFFRELATLHYQIVFSGKDLVKWTILGGIISFGTAFEDTSLGFGTEGLSRAMSSLEKESLGIHFCIGLIRNIKFVGEGERDFCLTHHFLTGIISGQWALTCERMTIHHLDSAGLQRPDTLKHFSEAHLLKTQWWAPLPGHLATHGWDHCGLVRWHLGGPARAKENITQHIQYWKPTGCDLFHKGAVTLAKFKGEKVHYQ